MTEPEFRYVVVVVKYADIPDAAGYVYPASVLEKMADNVRLYWDSELKALVYRGPQLIGEV